MKARVKATGEIVEVITVGDYINENGQIIGEYKDANGILYTSYELDFYIEEGIVIPDYWTRLEHTYVGMFMKSFLDNFDGTATMEQLSDDAIALAHALVEKLKEKEERK